LKRQRKKGEEEEEEKALPSPCHTHKNSILVQKYLLLFKYYLSILARNVDCSDK